MRIPLLFAALLLSVEGMWATVAIDAKVSKDQAAASATVVSPGVSTAVANELLLAFVSTDYLSGTNTTVQSVTGGGLTWALVARANAQSGTSEIWRAWAATTLSAAPVTATLSQAVASSLTVATFTGTDSTGANGSAAIGALASASAAKGAPSAKLTTTRNGSLVVGGGNDFDNAIARTPGASQSLVHQYLSAAGDTYWVQMQTNPIALSGTSVPINDTAPTSDRFNLAICEILASQSSGTPTWSASGSISPAASGSGAHVTISGAASGTVVVDTLGNYSFPGLSNGSYTLTPAKAGYNFSPPNQPITVGDANQTGVNFTAQPIPTWSISGTIAPAADGSGTSVILTGAANALMTADSSGNYSFSGLANGSYTVTPSKSGFSFAPPSRSVSLNGANSSGINFAATAPSGALGIDARISKDQTSASSTVTTPSFSTTSGQELLLAFIATDYLGGANVTVQSVSGAGLTWVMVSRSNAQSGTSEIWRAFAANSLNGASVSATLSQSVASSMTVLSFTGADGSGANGSAAIGAVASASAAKGAPSANLVTTRNNSMVLGVGNDFDNAIGRTPVTGQSLLHQYLSAAGDTYWIQTVTNPVPAAGTSVTLGDTAPTSDRYNLAICEILAASGATVIPMPPTLSMTSPGSGTLAGPVTVSAAASDNVAITSVQFLLDGSALGASLTSAPYTLAWDSKGTANGSHTISARAQNSAGQSSSATPVSITVDNSGNAAVVGSWSAAIALPAVAVNLILLPNNKLLFYQDGDTVTVWDYVNNTFTNKPTAVNIFCSGASLLADGRVFIAGGYGGTGSDIGIANAEIFDPTTNTWTTVPKMAYKRWYPTATTLSDGRVLVTAGWQTTAHSNAGISEIYDPASNSWTQLKNANNPFETYPFMYQLSDGRVLHVGGSEYATDTDLLDLSSQSWSVVDSEIVDGSSATMFAPGRFMKAGSASDSQDVGPSSNTTFVLDTTQPNPLWQQAPSMAYARSFMNLTMLPDGSVLATGGESDRNGGDISKAVYAAELWSPQTKNWSTLSSMHTPREYHGTAVLLPDGRVLESGMGADFGNVPDQKSAEFFSPPYLFKGPRPTITNVASELQYGATFSVTTPDAAIIAKVALIRLGAVTHFFDENERYVPLSFQKGNGVLTVTAPANAYLAPPGHYMLFLVNSAGVPSVAPFVHFTAQ